MKKGSIGGSIENSAANGNKNGGGSLVRESSQNAIS